MIRSIDLLENDTAESSDFGAFLAAALKQRRKQYRKAFRRCSRKCSESAVHQLRVETRRLVALLTLTRTVARSAESARIIETVRDLFKRLSCLRDTQVHLATVEKLCRRVPEASGFAKFLARRERKFVACLQHHLAAAEKKKTRRRVRRLRSRLRKGALTMHRNSRAIGMECLGAVFERVAAAHARIDPQRPETIHCARVAFKEFRYLAELLAPLLPEIMKAKLNMLRRHQTTMGNIQDVETLLAAFSRFERKCPKAAAKAQSLRSLLESRRRAAVARFMARPSRLDEVRSGFDFALSHKRFAHKHAPVFSSARHRGGTESYTLS